MRRLCLVLLAACTTQTSTPLRQLDSAYGATTIEVVVNGQFNIELHVDSTAGCPLLGDDVVARFDGVRMNVTPGGYDSTTNGCYPIAFWVTPVPATSVAAWERTTQGSGLVIA